MLYLCIVNDKQNKLIKIITIMKKSIIITVITLEVISIIVLSNKDKFSTSVKRNIAQCEMYNKVCGSELCEIDSLVRTFPQEYIILIIGEDGKVSEVKEETGKGMKVATIVPNVDFDKLNGVLIVIPKDGVSVDGEVKY